MGIRTTFNPMGGKKLEKCPFEQNETIFQSSTPGTYYKDVVDGVYEIWACGAGGGGGGTFNKGAGGQGAALKGTIYLTARTLSIAVGAGGGKYTNGGSTSISGLFTCGGGGGKANSSQSSGGGTLTVNATFLTKTLAANGSGNNTGSLLGNGFGAGGSSSGGSGTNGYVRIRYLRPKP